ncbi:hypothetical protein DFJ58DRAFT_763014 [Suillus subalutaceus]|uniref:uncharacterized protein n=1 Tax=Suillus subalutaceus TaxID=48586 RepID=UPI001B85EB8D|nr:uncharacterized protein DFJ58DRAFT_763014 [Suillus subalutaceus]KAG1871245.1 hypothetical protein DFJ58DRAFT_763014 [Suillus subalutaceus]
MNSLEGSTSDFDASVVIGPVQVFGLLSSALFGCLACQSYVYFAKFTSDGLALKATVSAVLLIQLGHFVCIMSMLWTMTVSTYGDPSQLNVFPLAADMVILLSSFTVSIVQSFYAFRLWKLSRNVSLSILCQMFSVVAQISTFILSARAFSMTDLTMFEARQSLLIMLAFTTRAVCDWITTAGIAWNLKKKRGSDIIDTTTMIDRLIYWTIETALITSLLAVTVIILLLVLKQNYVWFGAWLTWPNVIGNSMLISLNRRLLLQETRMPSRSHVQSRDGGLSTNIVFRAEATQPQTVPLKNLNVSQEAEHPIDQEQWQDCKPVIHLRECV